MPALALPSPVPVPVPVPDGNSVKSTDLDDLTKQSRRLAGAVACTSCAQGVAFQRVVSGRLGWNAGLRPAFESSSSIALAGKLPVAPSARLQSRPVRTRAALRAAAKQRRATIERPDGHARLWAPLSPTAR